MSIHAAVSTAHAILLRSIGDILIDEYPVHGVSAKQNRHHAQV
jgi:hypothetical protein